MTAASGPSPMATVKMSTHKMVGTARMMDMMILMMLLASLFERLLAAASPKTSAMAAAPKVVSTVKAKVTKSSFTSVAYWKCPSTCGCVAMVAKLVRQSRSACPRSTLP